MNLIGIGGTPARSSQTFFDDDNGEILDVKFSRLVRLAARTAFLNRAFAFLYFIRLLKDISVLYM